MYGCTTKDGVFNFSLHPGRLTWGNWQINDYPNCHHIVVAGRHFWAVEKMGREHAYENWVCVEELNANGSSTRAMMLNGKQAGIGLGRIKARIKQYVRESGA